MDSAEDQTIPFIPLDVTDIHILRLLAGGKAIAELAPDVDLTAETVAKRLRRAITKANARTREHLLAIAFRNGWIS